jgi:hypothetical protein
MHHRHLSVDLHAPRIGDVAGEVGSTIEETGEALVRHAPVHDQSAGPDLVAYRVSDVGAQAQGGASLQRERP